MAPKSQIIVKLLCRWMRFVAPTSQKCSPTYPSFNYELISEGKNIAIFTLALQRQHATLTTVHSQHYSHGLFHYMCQIIIYNHMKHFLSITHKMQLIFTLPLKAFQLQILRNIIFVRFSTKTKYFIITPSD